MKALRSYQNLLEAGFAQSLLEAAGIAAVLEHEASTSLSPVGASSARLMVPEADVAEADRILAEHPTRFSGVVEDIPRFGFWRGSILGVLGYLCLSGAFLLAFGAAHFNIPLLLLAWFTGGAIGANYKMRSNQAMQRTAGRSDV